MSAHQTIWRGAPKANPAIAAGTSLPALKALDPDWHLLLLDTLVRTHRFDFLGSWRGWLDPTLPGSTQAALAAVEKVIALDPSFLKARELRRALLGEIEEASEPS